LPGIKYLSDRAWFYGLKLKWEFRDNYAMFILDCLVSLYSYYLNK
jgi:hypothetical protein